VTQLEVKLMTFRL